MNREIEIMEWFLKLYNLTVKNMKFFRIVLLVGVLSFSAFTYLHKYYISVTQIEYVGEKQSVQIISRIFTDDFEKVLRERYDESITLDANKNETLIDSYIEKYLSEKIKIKIDGKDCQFKYLGKELDVDVVKVYLEIEGVKAISSFKITNKLLFDLFKDQKNMVKLNINSKKKSYLLTLQNDNALLNFN